MKFIHLSDLHLGKRVNEFSMIEDQKHILREILSAVKTEQPDAVIIAGDVYDKAVPPVEAVELFDWFLNALSDCEVPTLIISGNHDSAERIAFGEKLMRKSGICIAPVYNGTVVPNVFTDEFGTVNIYLLPFIKPMHVRRFYPEEPIQSYTDAMAVAIQNMHIDPTKRNILVTHQFVTGAVRSESEEVSVGGTDNIDAETFADFDYVALGHIHGPQNIGSEKIRYCGTPLKYSFSEAAHKKSITVVELKEKGNLSIRTIELKPLHDMAEIKGKYDELTLRSFYENTTYKNDYMHITLTDEEDIPEAIGKLRTIYHNLMRLDYDNARTRSSGLTDLAPSETKSPQEMFAEFYEKVNNQPMTPQQSEFAQKLIEDIWEDRT